MATAWARDEPGQQSSETDVSRHPSRVALAAPSQQAELTKPVPRVRRNVDGKEAGTQNPIVMGGLPVTAIWHPVSLDSRSESITGDPLGRRAHPLTPPEEFRCLRIASRSSPTGRLASPSRTSPSSSEGPKILVKLHEARDLGLRVAVPDDVEPAAKERSEIGFLKDDPEDPAEGLRIHEEHWDR